MVLLRKFLSSGSFFLLCALSAMTVDAEADFSHDEGACFDECESCCYPNRCFPVAGDVTIAFEHFRSLPDGSWEGNTGAYASVNLGMSLPQLSCCGFGAQLGGSYGIYDWCGRGSALEGNLKEVQRQGFLTIALFKRTPCASGLNGAIAYDWMFNENFGVFALNPWLSQLRYQASYLFCCLNELGFWGTVHTHTSDKSTMGLPVSFRAINQFNFFWRHFFENCAETMVWGGFPYGKSLMFSGKPGKYILGASFRVPLIGCWSIEGHATYMHAHHSHGSVESRNYASNVCIGLNYAFGGPECCFDRACDFRPYLPIANNSNFLADTSLNY